MAQAPKPGSVSRAPVDEGAVRLDVFDDEEEAAAAAEVAEAAGDESGALLGDATTASPVDWAPSPSVLRRNGSRPPSAPSSTTAAAAPVLLTTVLAGALQGIRAASAAGAAGAAAAGSTAASLLNDSRSQLQSWRRNREAELAAVAAVLTDAATSASSSGSYMFNPAAAEASFGYTGTQIDPDIAVEMVTAAAAATAAADFEANYDPDDGFATLDGAEMDAELEAWGPAKAGAAAAPPMSPLLLPAAPAVTLSGQHESYVCALAALPCGDRFASAGRDEIVRVWRVQAPLGGGPVSVALERELRGHTAFVSSLVCLRAQHESPPQPAASGRESQEQAVRRLRLRRGCLLASASADNSVRAWSARSGACVAVLEGHSNAVKCLAALVDGRLASGASDKRIYVWSADLSGRADLVLEGHTDTVSSLCALRGGQVLASASDDRTVRLWRLGAGESAAAHAFGGADRGVHQASEGVCLRVLTGHALPVHCLAQLADGRLASGGNDEAMRVWLVSAAAIAGDGGETSAELVEDNGPAFSLCALPGDRLAVGAANGSVSVFAFATGKAAAAARLPAGGRGHSSIVRALCVLGVPGRRLLVSAGNDERVCVWS